MLPYLTKRNGTLTYLTNRKEALPYLTNRKGGLPYLTNRKDALPYLTNRKGALPYLTASTRKEDRHADGHKDPGLHCVGEIGGPRSGEGQGRGVAVGR